MRDWTIEDLLCAQKCPRAFWFRTHGRADAGRAAQRILLSREAAEALRGPLAPDRALWRVRISGEGCACEADLLSRCAGGWELLLDASTYEIREPILREAAFAMRVLEANGFPVVRATALLLNEHFLRGAEMDWTGLYREKDITARARAFLPKIPARLERMEAVAALPEPPGAALAEYCLKPLECPFWAECTAALPQPNVFAITGVSAPKKLQLYRKGIVSFPDCLAGADLAPQQKTQVLMEILREPPRVRREPLRAFLRTLWYPMCFLDFESCQPPAPLYEGLRPFEQMAFQYSLHIVRAPGAAPEHRECIVPPGEDPRLPLAEGLVRDVPEDACLVVYSNGLEKHEIAALAERFPDLRGRLSAMNAAMRDLIIPFRARDYYDRAMQGSCSLKKVLPALCPDDPALSYARLDGVQNGHEAMRAYMSAELLDEAGWQATRERLSAYCAVDTLGMVRLVEALERAAWPDREDSIPLRRLLPDDGSRRGRKRG